MNHPISTPSVLQHLEFRNYRLDSGFQPIFGVAHRHIIGFEALLRVHSANGEMLKPRDFMDKESLPGDWGLDRLCSALHMDNFVSRTQPGNWLFLHLQPGAFVSGHDDQFFIPELLAPHNFPADHLVLEVLEHGSYDLSLLQRAFEYYRSLGCLLAIDNFGVGQSTVERVWQLQPDIVKLDKDLVRQSGTDKRVRKMLFGLVGLLHDAGALVVVEGVETYTEAMIALEADCDFVQGYYFGQPKSDLRLIHEQTDVFDQLWHDYRLKEIDSTHLERASLAPYIETFRQIPTRLLMDGWPLETAAMPFLALPAAALCFVLDNEGRQTGEGFRGSFKAHARSHFGRLQETAGASWVRRPYFRDAMHALGELQVSQPYLSASTGRFCVTLSIAYERGGQVVVLCGDLDWHQAIGGV